MTPRLPDWPDRFRAAISAVSKPFEWGANDCACAASAFVQALTGVDPLARFRGRYSSLGGAKAVVALAGFSNWADAATHVFAENGWGIIDPRAARVGDVGITSGNTFCVRTVSGFAARSNDGWALVRPDKLTTVWGIG